MKQEKEYYAFISYKREDEKWAKWLQRKLEHYRFPTSLNGRSDLPKNIRPTFRDVTDLNPGLLAEEIDNALRNSEWLIVICSPRSAKSPWVCKEAQTFIDLGQADHIIPFVIEGNPFSKDTAIECYPEALLNLTGSKELLAANINEMGRSAAVIKVIARMFNLRFDTLWKRHERTKRHHRYCAAVCILIFAFAGFGVGIYMAYLNTLIDRQNHQLQTTIDKLNVELNTITKNTSDKKMYYLIGNLIGRGKYNPLVGRDVVFHPKEPMLAFCDDTGFWLHHIGLNKEYHLEGTITDVTFFSFTTDGEYLVAQGSNGLIVWDVYKRKVHRKNNFNTFEKDLQDYPELLTDFNLPPNDKTNKKTCTLNYSLENKRLIIQDKNFKTIAETAFFQDSALTEKDITPLFNDKYKEVLFQYNGNAALFSIKSNKFTLFFKGHRFLRFSEDGEYIYDDDKLYARQLKIDTVLNIHPIRFARSVQKHIESSDTYRKELSNKNNIISKDGRKYYVDGNQIIVCQGAQKNVIEIVKTYTSGNMQGFLSDICDIGQHKVLCLMYQDWHKIVDTVNDEIIGGLGEYMLYDYDNRLLCGLGRESYLCHADTYDYDCCYLPNLNQLMIISSGGVIRVYDLYKNALKRIIVLPSNFRWNTRNSPLCSVKFNKTNYEIEYAFRDENITYHCNLKPYLEDQ